MHGFGKFAVRDGVILVTTIMAWIFLAGFSAGDSLFAYFIGASLGLAGGICAWFAHEWGHVLAGKLVGAKLRVPDRLTSVYLFGFDVKQNSKFQFVIMALGGFAATALAFSFAYFVLPSALMATKVLLGLILLEITVTGLLEIPGFLVGIFAYSRMPSVDVLGEERLS